MIEPNQLPATVPEAVVAVVKETEQPIVIKSQRRKSIAKVGAEVTQLGATKYGRGMYDLSAEHVMHALQVLRRKIRKETDPDRLERRLALYKDFISKAREIGRDFVESDQTPKRAQDDQPFVPSFAPGANVGASNKLTVIVQNEKHDKVIDLEK